MILYDYPIIRAFAKRFPLVRDLGVKVYFLYERHGLDRDLWRRFPVEKVRILRARHLYSRNYCIQDTPLISVTIATYNRSELLIERAISSVLNQTYQNFEIVVVGDGCTDNTEEQIARLNESRIRFYNLPKRGDYPGDPKSRWMVAGTPALNRALDESRGKWIFHLDDDDVYDPLHIEVLLRFAQENEVEFAYSRLLKQLDLDRWAIQGTEKFGEPSQVAHSAVMFRNYLKLFKFDINAWCLKIPVDNHTWLRMRQVGVRTKLLDQVTVSSPLRPETTNGWFRAEDRY